MSDKDIFLVDFGDDLKDTESFIASEYPSRVIDTESFLYDWERNIDICRMIIVDGRSKNCERLISAISEKDKSAMPVVVISDDTDDKRAGFFFDNGVYDIYKTTTSNRILKQRIDNVLNENKNRELFYNVSKVNSVKANYLDAVLMKEIIFFDYCFSKDVMRLRCGGNREISGKYKLDEFLRMLDDEDAPRFKRALFEVRENKEVKAVTFKVRRGTFSKKHLWYMASMFVKAIGDSDDVDVIGEINSTEYDSSPLKKLMRMVEIDDLSQLYNRSACEARMEEEIRNTVGKNKIFLIIDIDNFKEINDIYGHSIGDLAIKTAAQTIKSSFRTEDVIGRFGGDEFMALITNGVEERVITERVRTLSERFTERLRSMGINRGLFSMSAGAVRFSSEESLEMLIIEADKELYAVKNGGKGGFRLKDL